MTKNKMVIALMAEYRNSSIEYISFLNKISEDAFLKIRDETTKDPDCKSIQTVTKHVVKSGYIYASYIGSVIGVEWLEYDNEINNPKEAVLEIEKMLDYTELILDKIKNKTNKEILQWSFDARWGVTFDFEQLMEHAIVHFLRHRRQISNFLQ